MDVTLELAGETLQARRVIRRDSPTTSAGPAEDAALVAAARRGDRGAFGRLYDRHARMVHGLVLGRANGAEADDLVHDVFLAAMRRLHTLKDAEAFGPWLAAIARNRASDHRRRAWRTGDDAPEPADRGPVGRDEALEALDAIRSLPAAYRETLILRLVEGMTGPEIARRTGLTPGSVRVNLHRGMKLLRERLGGEGGG